MHLLTVLVFIYALASPCRSSDESNLCKGDECDFFANLQITDLLPNFQKAFKSIVVKRDQVLNKDLKRWCCRNGIPVQNKLIKTTFIEWDLTGATVALKSGQIDCGIFGMSKCTMYQIGFIPVSHLRYGYEIIPDEEAAKSCEDHHAVCCKGTMLVAGNCLTPQEFSEVTQVWKNLIPLLKEQNADIKLQDLIVALQNHGINEEFRETKPPKLNIDFGK